MTDDAVTVVSRHNRIAEVRFRGPLGKTQIIGNAVRLCALLPDTLPVLAVVYELRPAILCVAPDDLTSMARSQGRRASWCAAPGAMIVQPGSQDVYEEHASMMRRRGWLRAVFTDANQAREWAWQRARARALRLNDHGAELTVPDESSLWRP